MKRLLLLITLFTVITLPAFAQIPVGIGPGNNDNHTTPIGGMAVLAALGGGYAIKKLRGGKREA